MADHLISGHALAIKVDKFSSSALTSSFNDIQTTTLTIGADASPATNQLSTYYFQDLGIFGWEYNALTLMSGTVAIQRIGRMVTIFIGVTSKQPTIGNDTIALNGLPTWADPPSDRFGNLLFEMDGAFVTGAWRVNSVGNLTIGVMTTTNVPANTVAGGGGDCGLMGDTISYQV